MFVGRRAAGGGGRLGALVAEALATWRILNDCHAVLPTVFMLEQESR